MTTKINTFSYYGIGNPKYYNGGRYYSVFFYHLLKELYEDTIVYTDVEYEALNKDFDLYTRPEYQKSFKPRQADIYIGDQYDGVIHAFMHAATNHKIAVGIILDSPEWILRNDYINKHNTVTDELKGHIKLKNAISKYLKLISDYRIVVLTENSIDSHARWYGLDPNKYIAIHPSINDRLLNHIDLYGIKKQNYIVTVNRNNYRKNWETLFKLFSKVQDNTELRIVTDSIYGDAPRAVYDFEKLICCSHIAPYKVKFYERIKDIDKFCLLAGAKVLWSTSPFEGFGMWAIEGLHTNTPVVCYDLESLQEVQSENIFKCLSSDSMIRTINKLINTKDSFICDIDFSSERKKQKINTLIKSLI